MVAALLFTAFIFVLTLLYLVFYIKPKLKNSNKKLKLVMFNNRLSRINSFEKISENILQDILEALKDLNGSYEQVHAIYPLLCDIRKHGDRLMTQRKFYHVFFFPDCERKLTHKLRRLHQVENFIKSLSKHRTDSQSSILPTVLRKVESL